MKLDCTHHNMCFFFSFFIFVFFVFFKVRALFVGGVMLRDEGGKRRDVTLNNAPSGSGAEASTRQGRIPQGGARLGWVYCLSSPPWFDRCAEGAGRRRGQTTRWVHHRRRRQRRRRRKWSWRISVAKRQCVCVFVCVCIFLRHAGNFLTECSHLRPQSEKQTLQ